MCYVLLFDNIIIFKKYRLSESHTWGYCACMSYTVLSMSRQISVSKKLIIIVPVSLEESVQTSNMYIRLYLQKNVSVYNLILWKLKMTWEKELPPFQIRNYSF